MCTHFKILNYSTIPFIITHTDKTNTNDNNNKNKKITGINKDSMKFSILIYKVQVAIRHEIGPIAFDLTCRIIQYVIHAKLMNKEN